MTYFSLIIAMDLREFWLIGRQAKCIDGESKHRPTKEYFEERLFLKCV